MFIVNSASLHKSLLFFVLFLSMLVHYRGVGVGYVSM